MTPDPTPPGQEAAKDELLERLGELLPHKHINYVRYGGDDIAKAIDALIKQRIAEHETRQTAKEMRASGFVFNGD